MVALENLDDKVAELSDEFQKIFVYLVNVEPQFLYDVSDDETRLRLRFDTIVNENTWNLINKFRNLVDT